MNCPPVTEKRPPRLHATGVDARDARIEVELAVAALLEAEALSFSGGEQAVTAVMVTAAMATTTERWSLRTVFLLLRRRHPAHAGGSWECLVEGMRTQGSRAATFSQLHDLDYACAVT